MKTQIFLFSFIFCLFFAKNSLFSQNKVENFWKKETIEQANTAQNANYLASNEKRVIFFLNLARLDPAGFAKNIEKIWKADSKNEFGQTNNLGQNKWFQSLLKDLQSTKPMSALQPNEALSTVAKKHAADMGKIGQIGHKSPDGTTFDKRIRKALPKAGFISENCDYGNSNPLDIVMSLLVDQDVPSLGHRKNILNPVYKRIGVGILPHKKYQINTVMDFAD